MANASDPEFPCSMQVFLTSPPPRPSQEGRADRRAPASLNSSIDVPLPTERLASAALQSIQVDKELSPLVRRTMTVGPGPGGDGDGDTASRIQLLRVHYRATTNRMLRVAVNSFMESLRLVMEVMEQLDVDVLEQKIQAGQPENSS